MKKYKLKLILVTCIFLLIIVLTTISYAIFSDSVIDTNTNNIAAHCFDIQFTEDSESINLTNSYPMTDGAGLKMTPYTFTVSNNCDGYVEYNVIASVINIENSYSDDVIKVALAGATNINPTNVSSLTSADTPLALSSDNVKKSYYLVSNASLNNGDSSTYNFRMWLDGSKNDLFDSNNSNYHMTDYRIKITIVATALQKPSGVSVYAYVDGNKVNDFPTTNNYDASVSCKNSDGTSASATSSLAWNSLTNRFEFSLTGVEQDNIVCKAEFASYPFKGDLITMNVGDGLPTQYRVMKIDGSQALVLSMTNYGSKIAWGTGTTTTFTDGTTNVTGQQYAGSTADTLLNTTMYNAMNATAQSAVVQTTINQNLYNLIYGTSASGTQGIDYWKSYYGFDGATPAYYINKKGNGTKTMSVVVGERYIYLLDVEDVLEYFDNEVFKPQDINTLFWNQTKSKSESLWLRSARSSNSNYVFRVYGNNGQLSIISYSNTYYARPAFTIDLSKITWTLTN